MTEKETKLDGSPYIPQYWFKIGKTIIDVTPSGMWGHYVWQSTAPFICSGVKRNEDETRTYRFTQIGDSSIKLPGKGYADIEFTEEDVNKNYISKVEYSAQNYELRIFGCGWIKFRDNYNKRVFRNRKVIL